VATAVPIAHSQFAVSPQNGHVQLHDSNGFSQIGHGTVSEEFSGTSGSRNERHRSIQTF